MSLQRFHGSGSYPADIHPVLTIGNFDGVHLGHQALLRRVVERARELQTVACVYTFEPAPRRVLQPDRCPPRILPLEDKLALIAEAGVEQVVVETFTTELSEQPAEWFAHEVLGRRLHPQAMVVGYDFRFGRGRQGDVAALGTFIPDLPVEAVAPLHVGERIASSSAIREHVARGEVERAAVLLGRPFSVRGEVVHGDGRGRTIGFPTANIASAAELLPAPGVYAVRVRRNADGELPGVANLGVRPTFDGHRFAIEVHLLDLSGDLYGETLELRFIRRLRPELRFSDVDALVAQIHQDAAKAREILAT